MVAVFWFPHLTRPPKSFHGIHVNKGIPSIWVSSEKMCQYCHYRDFFLASVYHFALVGLKIAMDGNPIARKGSKFPGLKKFHRSQLIQNSNWKLHPLQICIASQFLNLHHWQPNLTAAAYIYGYIHFDKKYSVWILLTKYHEYRHEYHSYALLPKRVTRW